MGFRTRVLISSLFVLIVGCAATPAVGEVRTGHFFISFAPYSPILALIAGILILIFPRILNYIVAIYLIVIGLAGIFLH